MTLRSLRRRPLVALAVAATLAIFLVAPPRVRAEDGAVKDATLQAARRLLPGVVRVQWRSRGERPVIVERHGVVVDPDGWLLLAGPPLPEEGTLAATLQDDRSMSARVWAADPTSGLTLLRLPVSGLSAVPLREVTVTEGRSMVPRRLKPGRQLVMVTAEGAVARGTLRGSHRTRVLGRTGGVAREVSCLDEAALNVIQTDLGAPWIDVRGRVVGLLVGADVATPQFRGTAAERLRPRPEVVAAYAVPSSVIRTVWPLLRDHREVHRGALGVWSKPLSDVLQRHVCRDCGGRVVTDVVLGGAAEHAGILQNDIIRKLGGHPFAPDATLADVLLPYRPGDRVRIGLLRAGEDLDVDVVLDPAE